MSGGQPDPPIPPLSWIHTKESLAHHQPHQPKGGAKGSLPPPAFYLGLSQPNRGKTILGQQLRFDPNAFQIQKKAEKTTN
jgi:hypothetical protein